MINIENYEGLLSGFLFVIANRIACTFHRIKMRLPLVILAFTTMGTLLSPASAQSTATSYVDDKHAVSSCVVLLHGLARSESAMKTLQSALSDEGYYVVNQGYPSTKFPIEQLAHEAIDTAHENCGDHSPIHFVTHSMGGILVRHYFSQHQWPELGRVVMLAPPNKGSEVVDNLGSLAPFEWINGPAGLELGTSATSTPNRLGSVDFELGVIAGSRTFNLLLSLLLPNPDDGKVSVDKTVVEGMDAHIVMPVTHTFMMSNDDVIEQVIQYLAYGEFDMDSSTINPDEQIGFTVEPIDSSNTEKGSALIPHIVVEPNVGGEQVEATAAVIWLHGLGANGHDFEPVIPELGLPSDAAVRFIFPHAPSRPVTINGGIVMPAWFDIISAGENRQISTDHLLDAASEVARFIEDQIEKGIPSERIVIAGFSQGGAVAYHAALNYPKPLAGLMTLSTYFLTHDIVSFEPANSDMPIFIMHGESDPVILPALGAKAQDILRTHGYPFEWKTYPMAHQVCMPQLVDIGRWLTRVLDL